MTERGKYLKALVDKDTGRISVRKLAEQLAERDDMPNTAEKIRRTLQRHIANTENTRDVSNRYVEAISAVLGIDAAAWPPPTQRPTRAALQQQIDDLQAELARVLHGDPSAPAQDGGR